MVKIGLFNYVRFSSPSISKSVEHKGGIYAYHTLELKNDSADHKWHTYKMIFLTPEMRTRNDKFKCYIWNRQKASFDIDNFRLDQYEPNF